MSQFTKHVFPLQKQVLTALWVPRSIVEMSVVLLGPCSTIQGPERVMETPWNLVEGHGSLWNFIESSGKFWKIMQLLK